MPALHAGLQSSLLLQKTCWFKLAAFPELNVTMNALFEHWKSKKWLQKMGEPLSNVVSCLFVTCGDK